ncbi:MAG: hypothetical protein BWY09_02270 [Candidatus Hydrogenedentes bacterium ADurb.Bin179]|nr:MAG: hypothetical protein BWY09_02270 [Candidatus Hydrogenedentes bacterium ADurb.Bin179]
MYCFKRSPVGGSGRRSLGEGRASLVRGYALKTVVEGMASSLQLYMLFSQLNLHNENKALEPISLTIYYEF